jgi:hypothetical protein
MYDKKKKYKKKAMQKKLKKSKGYQPNKGKSGGGY